MTITVVMLEKFVLFLIGRSRTRIKFHLGGQPEILVVLCIHGHVYKNIHWIIFVTTSNSAFKSGKQIYIHEIKIQKYHYFNQCIWRFAYHTSNHYYHEYKFVYYINTNAAANNNHKVTGIAKLNAFSCANKNKRLHP